MTTFAETCSELPLEKSHQWVRFINEVFIINFDWVFILNFEQINLDFWRVLGCWVYTQHKIGRFSRISWSVTLCGNRLTAQNFTNFVNSSRFYEKKKIFFNLSHENLFSYNIYNSPSEQINKEFQFIYKFFSVYISICYFICQGYSRSDFSCISILAFTTRRQIRWGGRKLFISFSFDTLSVANKSRNFSI